MPTVAEAVKMLDALAPPALAEPWDNVGLLVGDPAAPLRLVVTCLTLTPDVVAEAVQAQAGLVVTHHPLPFRPVKTLTTATDAGANLLRLARAGVAVYSPHTAYDSAAGGVNQQWAERLELTEIRPLVPAVGRNDGSGAGRIGRWEGWGGFGGLCEAVKKGVNLPGVRVVDPRDPAIHRVAIACGSGGSLVEAALAAGCDTLVTGELGFHDCLACRSAGVGVVLTGHFASERFAVETLAARLAEWLPGVEAYASGAESDPLRPA